MPELPEVETTLRGIKTHLEHAKIKKIVIRQRKLRWPISSEIEKIVKNQPIKKIWRRGKYILFKMDQGTLILHLGMSGSLRILSHYTPPLKHDHFDIELSNKKLIRFNDPRRFGAFLWTEDPNQHFLIKNLGQEPLDKNFSGKFLFDRLQNKKVAIKSFIMNNKIVVGVGNIYASEALFASKLNPNTPAYKLDLKKCTLLANEIKKILRLAIKKGGTTLKDFLNSDGKPGYFKLHLKVYGRGGLLCVRCKNILKEIRIGQRSTVYCPLCQK